MDKQKYIEAVKDLQAKKPKENYLLLTFGYDNKLVLPYKDGMNLMSSLTNAEHLSGGYSDERIKPFHRDNVTIQVMSPDEYQQYKLAALLNVPISDIRELQQST
jgi:hypothetical protein